METDATVRATASPACQFHWLAKRAQTMSVRSSMTAHNHKSAVISRHETAPAIIELAVNEMRACLSPSLIPADMTGFFEAPRSDRFLIKRQRVIHETS